MSWKVETLIQGYPGKSKQQGGLGFSTVAVAWGPEGRIAVLDTGRTGARRLLLERLKEVGVTPVEVTDVLITHMHYDHAENWSMFHNALIHVPGAELDWSVSLPDGAPLVSEFAARALAICPRMRRIAEGETGVPGITCFEAPGHSPHHVVFVLAGDPPTIFSSDVAKNRAELATGIADLTMDAVAHKTAIARLNAEWRRVPGTVLLPGHDVALTVGADDKPLAHEARKMTIQAWFGDSLEDATFFDLTEKELG